MKKSAGNYKAEKDVTHPEMSRVRSWVNLENKQAINSEHPPTPPPALHINVHRKSSEKEVNKYSSRSGRSTPENAFTTTFKGSSMIV